MKVLENMKEKIRLRYTFLIYSSFEFTFKKSGQCLRLQTSAVISGHQAGSRKHPLGTC